MDTRAQHLLAEYFGCDADRLNDRQGLERLMREAADAAGASVVGAAFHPYSPHGVTGVLLIAESHFSLHTWPEHGYAAADFYTCGSLLPERALEPLGRGLSATRVETLLIERGRGEAAPFRIVPRSH